MTLEGDLVRRIVGLERRLAEIEARENAANRLPFPLGTTTYREDFTSIPSGYTWAGSPFSTPPTVTIVNQTVLATSGFTGSEKSFYYVAMPASLRNYFYLPYLNTNLAGQYAGLRIDDGTDNNYVEAVVQWQNTNPPLLYRIYYRTGGGTVTTITPSVVPSNAHLPDAFYFFISGTLWSSWQVELSYYQRYTQYRTGATTPAVSWMPTRIGYVAKHGTSTWMSCGIDYITW